MIDGARRGGRAPHAKYVRERAISAEEIRAAVRKGTIAMKLFPVICGASFKNKGVQPLLDAVIDYLPSPLERPAGRGHQIPRAGGSKSGARRRRAVRRARVQDHERQHVGQLVFLRVYSGTLEAGSGVYNSTKGKKERVGRLLRMHAKQEGGDRGRRRRRHRAAIGLKLTTTGDTLCDPDEPIVLESMTFPEP